MRCFRFYFVVSLCLLVMGAVVGLAQPPSPNSQSSPPAPPPKPDKQAGELLDEAIKRLDPIQLGWVETTLWQQMNLQGVAMRGEGRFLAGPDHHLRLNLAVALENITGKLELVCDGQTLWEALQLGGQDREVIRKVDIKKVLAEIQNPKATELFLQNQSFFGVVALLKTLKEKMVFTDRESLRWQGHDVQVLTGVWSEETTKRLGPPNRWPAFFPRQCRVFLDSQAPHWPHRVEWWGLVPYRFTSALLIQTEFRNPHWGFKLTDEQIAKEFHFEPGKKETPDLTDRELETLKMLARQLAGQESK